MSENLDGDFEQFVQARSTALLRFAVLLVGDLQHAQDALQRALWRTYRHWSRASEHPDAYVRVVLVNLCRDHYRQHRRRPRDVTFEPDAHLEQRDAILELLERDALVRAMRHLPNRQRATIVLRFWEQLSIEEAAATLGCSTGTIKSNTSHALRALRRHLGEPSGAADTKGVGHAD